MTQSHLETGPSENLEVYTRHGKQPPEHFQLITEQK